MSFWMHSQCLARRLVCTYTCTYIDAVLLVALVQVVHDSSLMELSQGRHILHAIDAGLVHGAHPLPVDLGLLQVQHLCTARRKNSHIVTLKDVTRSSLNLYEPFLFICLVFILFMPLFIRSLFFFSMWNQKNWDLVHALMQNRNAPEKKQLQSCSTFSPDRLPVIQHGKHPHDEKTENYRYFLPDSVSSVTFIAMATAEWGQDK